MSRLRYLAVGLSLAAATTIGCNDALLQEEEPQRTWQAEEELKGEPVPMSTDTTDTDPDLRPRDYPSEVQTRDDTESVVEPMEE